jgi:hypothetical protein
MSQSIRVAAIGVPSGLCFLFFVLCLVGDLGRRGGYCDADGGPAQGFGRGAALPAPHGCAGFPAGGITAFWRLRVTIFTIFDCAPC